jgi:hypothetical protein
VNHYRCRACEHEWTTSKQDGSIVVHITPRTGRTPSNADAISLKTRVGDVLIQQYEQGFHVWLVLTPGSLQPDRSSEPFTTAEHPEALEWAWKLARATKGRVFSIDRAGVWAEERRRRGRQ